MDDLKNFRQREVAHTSPRAIICISASLVIAIGISAACIPWSIVLYAGNCIRWLVGMLLSVVGALSILFKIGQVVLEPVWYFFLRPSTSFEEYKGDWAVVTGASRGLGEGYAVALARRGLNIVLVARDKAKLETVASRCEVFGVKAHVLAVDLLQDPETLCPRIQEELSSLKGVVSIVVNNVGGKPVGLPCSPMPSYCENMDYVTFLSFIKFNTLPTIFMTQMCLQDMVKRNKGYILNVSSMNGLQYCPYLAPYSAAKAYVLAYCACLKSELHGRCSNVYVDGVCPGPVATDGIGRNGLATNRIPDPVAFAESSLSLAKTSFALVPWPWHWWSMQFLGPNSHILPKIVTDTQLYKAMDYSKLLG